MLSCAVRRFTYRGSKEPAMSGSGRIVKGVANVAETGPAACKSRATLSVGEGAYALETGYHRCHGEECMSDCPYNSKSTQDPSVWRTNPLRRDMLREPGWSDRHRLGVSVLDTLPPGPETERSQGSQGQSRPPKASRVSKIEHGNPDTSAWSAKPGKPPGPARSRTGGRAFVVVRARESRVHGEGRQ